MKKVVTLLLCITAVCALSFSALIGCGKTSPATAIEVVDPVTEYYVNDKINYDTLQVKITYADGTSYQNTAKYLKLTLAETADLTKEGKTHYTLTFGLLTATVEITVKEMPKFVTAYGMPSFYTNYLNASKERAVTDTEERGDFRKTGEVYEVGNVNKFIFRPSVTVLDETDTAVTIANAQTTVKVYEKATEDGTYVLIPDTDLEGIVEVDDNTYQFSNEAAGKYYKLEITLDSEAYDVTTLKEDNRTITVEFKVIGGGYNAYDQMGLSVMNDLNSNAWTEIWKCEIDSDFNLISNENSLQLEADDKPLCEYVGNVDWVILHKSITLNADELPASFFWTTTDKEYTTAYNALQGVEGAQELLEGSLKDGIANDKWYRVLNYDAVKNEAPQLNITVNMQKGLFSSYRVSVSGNYNSVVVPETASEGGRSFYSVLDHELSGDNRMNPMPHWNLFQMTQSHNEGMQYSFTIKNIAASGNLGQKDTTKFVPAGLNMINCYGQEVNIQNVLGDKFYTNVSCDSYGETGFTAENTKFYDAYSNMFYMWRTNVKVNNCEFMGSGGPLFILCDGENEKNEAGGPVITVDTKSVLQAYATGNESWYVLNNANTLISMLTGTLETSVLNNVGKTVLVEKDGNQYANIIAAMICEPSKLMAGLNNGKLIVRGTYRTVDENGNVVEEFTVQNDYVQMLSGFGQGDATGFAPVFQTGNNKFFANLLEGALYTFNGTTPQQFGTMDGYNWMTDTHDKLAVYMSAGPVAGSKNAPYFGVIVGASQYTAQK